MRHFLATYALLAAFSASPALADVTSTGDVEPASPATWTASTTAYIGNTAGGTLTVNNGSALASGQTFLGYYNGVAGQATVDGSGSTWTNSGGLYVGHLGGTGTLNVTNGGAVWANSSSLYVGYYGAGTVNVTNGGFLSVNSAGLYLGDGAVGTLNVTGGGAVSSGSAYVGNFAWAASPSTATVDGANSSWTSSGYLNVGASGTVGALNITNGATVSSLAGVVGSLTGGNINTGTAIVDGVGSTWTNQKSLEIGYGTLTITNGGAVSSSSGSVGLAPAGTVTVDGRGSIWTDSGDLLVGVSGSGTLNVTNGGAVSSTYGYIGLDPGSPGSATVDGSGSKWTASSDLHVGDEASGTLNVTNGSAVSVAGATYVGFDTRSTCTINFGANGGTLTTGSLAFSSPSQLRGTGTIDANGMESDTNLVFDATHGLKQTFTFNSLSGQNVTLNLDLSNPANNGLLGAGYWSAGSLTIQGGVAVTAAAGYLGYNSGSTGTATVTGPGSTWANIGDLVMASAGSAYLAITNGGAVSDAGCIMGYDGGGATVSVDGAGSKWTTSGWIGEYGSINISGGGAVTAAGTNFDGLLSIDVGRGSSLTLSSELDNNGITRFLAGAGVPAGDTYSPISAPTWSGSATDQAVGGTWNATSHVFTVSQVATGTAGSPVTIDQSQEQRILITDPASGKSVGASFLATTSSVMLSLTASPLTANILNALDGELAPGDSVLSGWTFSTSGYTAEAGTKGGQKDKRDKRGHSTFSLDGGERIR